MFLGQPFLGDVRETIQPVQENQVHPDVQEIHIEIVGHNEASETISTQDDNISCLSEYYTNAFKEESTPVQELKCYYCEEKFLCFKALYNHSWSKHAESTSHPLKCFMCHQLFAFRNEYRDHLVLDHQTSNPDAICHICLIPLPNSQALMNHMSSHEAGYSCECCGAKFYTQDQLALHQQYHNCSKKFICDVCGIACQSKLLLGLHSLRHQQAECPLATTDSCSSFQSDIELVSHFKETHQGDYQSLINIIERYDTEEASLDDVLQTIARDKTCISLNDGGLDIQNWTSKVTLKQDVECITCSVKLTSVFQLWLHFLKNHPTSKKCPICEKQFKEATNILLHLGSESCETYQDSVSTLTCPQCQVTFNQTGELLEHQLTHVKPFQCSECDSCFQKQLELKRHLLDHGVPPKIPEPIFVCPVCSSNWPCLTNLRRHIRTHANERQFHCNVCGASFKRQQTLTAHSASAHGSKTHACPHCKNSCRTKQALFLHVCRVHVRLRRFICGRCAKPWPQNQDLRRHLSNTHKLHYPPLTKSMMVSSKEVHIIPPLENLAPEDPLRMTIAEVISKENEKLTRLYSDFGVGTSSALPPEDPVQEQPELTPLQEANKIYLSCDSCDFRCEDFNTWIEHTIGHEQISLNPHTSIPLDIVNVPIVPVEPIFIAPVLPTPTVNYGTLITVLPTPNLATINEPFPTIDPALIQPSVVVPQVETFVPPQGIVMEGIDTEKSYSNPDSGELININGMFVRIERFDGDASELISKSTISFENAACGKTDDASQLIRFENATDEIGENGLDDGAGSELISKSTISFGNAACGETDDTCQLIRFENATDDIGGRRPDGGSVLIRERMITFENAACEKTDDTSQLIRFENATDEIGPDDGAGSELISKSTISFGNAVSGETDDASQLIRFGNATDDIGRRLNGGSVLIRERMINAACEASRVENAGNEQECENASELIISLENAVCAETNELTSGNKQLSEEGDNESVTSDESNLTDELNENIEDIVRLANEGSGIEIHPSDLLRFTQGSDVLRSPEKGAPCSCDQCGKILSSSKSLQRHLRIHTGAKPFTCVVCDKTFTENYNLKVHMLSHTQERPYCCPTCGKKVRYLKEFVDHQKVHEGIKRNKCTICGRCFVRQRELVRHQKTTHSSEKKYQCPVCAKLFPRLDSLKVHIPSMHGKFSCDKCVRRFANQTQLDQHQRAHSRPPAISGKERPTCPICEKTFARAPGLKAHLQLHANTKAQIVCYACPRKFLTMDAMLTHLGNFHKKWRDEIAEENRGIIENCRISVKTGDPAGEVYTQNIEGVFKVNALKDIVISPQ